MHRFISLASLTAAAILSTIAPAAAQNDFGTGYIQILNSTNWQTATPADKVGCLNNVGRLVLDDCAVFTHLDANPYSLSTDAGACTFYDTASPANTASPYGRSTYALTCTSTWTVIPSDDVYTLSGMPYPFLCQGEIDCYVDVGGVPTAESDAFNVWQYETGGEGTAVPQGHLQGVMLWVATD